MRLPSNWLFGALGVALMCTPPVFGQTAASTPAQTPSYSPAETAAFRAYFMEIMDLEARADQLKAQGKDDTAMRGAVQKSAHLTDQETSLLRTIAQQCNAAYAAQTATGASAVNSLRQQYPPVAGAPPPAAVARQLAALEAQRSSIIAGCMQQLKAGMGTDRFIFNLDLYVLVHVGSKLKHGSLPPSAQGVTAPQ